MVMVSEVKVDQQVLVNRDTYLATSTEITRVSYWSEDSSPPSLSYNKLHNKNIVA